MRSRAYTSSCPGISHVPSITDVRSDGRAECPVCGRWIKVVRGPRYGKAWGQEHGHLSRHGFTEGPFVGTVETTADQARAMLRMAQLEFKQVHEPWLRAVEGRARAAYLAAEAGITDTEIAEVYGIPRPHVHRMRVRVATRIREKEIADG